MNNTLAQLVRGRSLHVTPTQRESKVTDLATASTT